MTWGPFSAASEPSRPRRRTGTLNRQARRLADALVRLFARPAPTCERTRAAGEVVGADVVIDWVRYLAECGCDSTREIGMLVMAASLASVIDDDEARSVVDLAVGVVMRACSMTSEEARRVVACGDVVAVGLDPRGGAIAMAADVGVRYLLQDRTAMVSTLTLTLQQLAYLRDAGQMVALSCETYAAREGSSVAVDAVVDGDAGTSQGTGAQDTRETASEPAQDDDVTDVDAGTGEAVSEAQTASETPGTQDPADAGGADDGTSGAPGSGSSEGASVGSDEAAPTPVDETSPAQATDSSNDVDEAGETPVTGDADETDEASHADATGDTGDEPEGVSSDAAGDTSDAPTVATPSVAGRNAGCVPGIYTAEEQEQAISDRAATAATMQGFLRDTLDVQFGRGFGAANPALVMAAYRVCDRLGPDVTPEDLAEPLDFYGTWKEGFRERVKGVAYAYAHPDD